MYVAYIHVYGQVEGYFFEDKCQDVFVMIS